MDVHVNDEINCALLFDQFYPPVDVAAVLALLDQAFPDAGFSLQLGGQEEKFFLLEGQGPLFILVSQNRRPLPSAGFRQALHSPYQQMLSPRIDQAVAEHGSNISITVSHKLPSADLVNPEFKVSAQPAPLVERKIQICQRLVDHLAAPLEATAIHWGQSNLILAPDMFAGFVAQSRFPSPLHLHPQLFSSGQDLGGRRMIGFTTFGARHVIGAEIRFNEGPADIGWMLERSLDLLQMARLNDYRPVPHGDSFGASADEVIRVRHRPAEGEDVPLIELTAETCAEQGIGVAPPPAAPASGRPVFGKRRSP